jgi:hypothetical protein
VTGLALVSRRVSFWSIEYGPSVTSGWRTHVAVVSASAPSASSARAPKATARPAPPAALIRAPRLSALSFVSVDMAGTVQRRPETGVRIRRSDAALPVDERDVDREVLDRLGLRQPMALAKAAEPLAGEELVEGLLRGQVSTRTIPSSARVAEVGFMLAAGSPRPSPGIA